MPIAGYYGPYSVYDTNKERTFDLLTEDVFQKISDLGINLINKIEKDYANTTKQADIIKSLQLATQYNIGVLVSDARIQNNSSSEQIVTYLTDYARYKAFQGISVVDEPSGVGYGTERPITDYSEKTKVLNSYDSMFAYVNLLPLSYKIYSGTEVLKYTELTDVQKQQMNNKYVDYVQNYIDTCKPKMLSWDYYVFDEGIINGITTTKEEYFVNLSLIRQLALKNNIPFWSYVQAGSNWNDARNDLSLTLNPDKHPTQSEMFWNVNTALAYGAKGIQYFPLIQPYYFAYAENNQWDFDRNGLIGADGDLTTWGESATLANKQIAVVDEVLMNATNTAILWTGNDVTSVLGAGTTSDNNILESITTKDESRNALVGVFEYQGKSAYYVVNYDTDASNVITLKFKGTPTYKVISAQMEEAHTGTSGSTCALNIAAGGAALLMIE